MTSPSAQLLAVLLRLRADLQHQRLAPSVRAQEPRLAPFVHAQEPRLAPFVHAQDRGQASIVRGLPAPNLSAPVALLEAPAVSAAVRTGPDGSLHWIRLWPSVPLAVRDVCAALGERTFIPPPPGDLAAALLFSSPAGTGSLRVFADLSADGHAVASFLLRLDRATPTPGPVRA